MSTETRYVIEGRLDGKEWIDYASLGEIGQATAKQVFRAWQEQRDATGAEVRYRLAERVTTSVILLEEDAP